MTTPTADRRTELRAIDRDIAHLCSHIEDIAVLAWLRGDEPTLRRIQRRLAALVRDVTDEGGETT